MFYTFQRHFHILHIHCLLGHKWPGNYTDIWCFHFTDSETKTCLKICSRSWRREQTGLNQEPRMHLLLSFITLSVWAFFLVTHPFIKMLRDLFHSNISVRDVYRECKVLQCLPFSFFFLLCVCVCVCICVCLCICVSVCVCLGYSGLLAWICRFCLNSVSLPMIRLWPLPYESWSSWQY